MEFELPPPDRETQAQLEAIANSPRTPPADARYVRFYSRSRENPVKSWGGTMTVNGKEEVVPAAGRPIFEPIEYVEILTVGDKDNIVDRPVRTIDKYIWADKYRAYRRGQSQEMDGMLLSVWGGVSPERVMEFAHFKLKTVEQLADVPDSSLPQLGIGARAEREKAKAYLAVMRDNAPIAELKAENEELKARMAALERLANPSPGAPIESVKAKRGKSKGARARQPFAE